MIRPSTDYLRTRIEDPPPLLSGLDRWVHDLAGWRRRASGPGGSLEGDAARVGERIAALARLGQEPFRDRLREIAREFRGLRRPDPAIVLEGLSLVSLAASRTLGLEPYPAQIRGARALHDGFLIEMATGEGKSLTAALAAPLFAWSGRPFHIITVNDYLARRDAEEMRALYQACGLDVSSVVHDMSHEERRQAHLASVVYTTSHQLLADFLRDRIELGDRAGASRRAIWSLLDAGSTRGDRLVLRGIDTALVDEADSVLVDEAVTPLIIGVEATNPRRVDAARVAEAVARDLERGRDYTTDVQHRGITFTRAGLARLEAAAGGLTGLWRGAGRRQELVVQALLAREFYRRDHEYVVQDGKIVIVEEFTGRLKPDNAWTQGLHQAVEAHEGVEITNPTETVARLSFQRFFRLFRRLCGMSGTVSEVSRELWHIYELPVLRIPTHRPCRRKVLPDQVHRDQEEKLRAIVESIRQLHGQGRPVLCGTRSIHASESLARRLETAGLPCHLLNATRHAEEAEIVARAGQHGAITIATNMAGRGTDIKLGPGVSERGGLHVIAAERNESRRVDRQLFGRCARQGDPGSAQAFLCHEDELIRRFLPVPLQRGLEQVVKMSPPMSPALVRCALRFSQAIAQTRAYQQREGVLRIDEELEESLSFAGRTDGV